MIYVTKSVLFVRVLYERQRGFTFSSTVAHALSSPDYSTFLGTRPVSWLPQAKHSVQTCLFYRQSSQRHFALSTNQRKIWTCSVDVFQPQHVKESRRSARVEIHVDHLSRNTPDPIRKLINIIGKVHLGCFTWHRSASLSDRLVGSCSSSNLLFEGRTPSLGARLPGLHSLLVGRTVRFAVLSFAPKTSCALNALAGGLACYPMPTEQASSTATSLPLPVLPYSIHSSCVEK